MGRRSIRIPGNLLLMCERRQRLPCGSRADFIRSGEYGVGMMANELSLGCDCVGHIQYLVIIIRLMSCLFENVAHALPQPGSFVGNAGNPVVIKHVICIHEEDSGLLWKHTDYRVGGRSHAVRRRRLVVSMVCTLANYGG
jgi:primary-amine oxidase